MSGADDAGRRGPVRRRRRGDVMRSRRRHDDGRRQHGKDERGAVVAGRDVASRAYADAAGIYAARSHGHASRHVGPVGIVGAAGKGKNHCDDKKPALHGSLLRACFVGRRRSAGRPRNPCLQSPRRGKAGALHERRRRSDGKSSNAEKTVFSDLLNFAASRPSTAEGGAQTE